MRFVKMHGLGNDFVVVPAAGEAVGDLPSLARAVCDRHRGVGADGLLAVMPPRRGVDAHLRMRVLNADGSEAEMCGNGIRCVCKLAFDEGLCRASPMRIETGRGVVELTYALGDDGAVETVTVAMGEPRVTPLDPEALRPEDFPGGAAWRAAARLEAPLVTVSLGNPHLVLFCGDATAVPLDDVGPWLERHPRFPDRSNVHFAQVTGPADVRVRTWERGAGATLACGTGASSVCAAAASTGRTDRRLRAHLPGGVLHLDWKPDGEILMTGPAVRVFAGEWPL